MKYQEMWKREFYAWRLSTSFPFNFRHSLPAAAATIHSRVSSSCNCRLYRRSACIHADSLLVTINNALHTSYSNLLFCMYFFLASFPSCLFEFQIPMIWYAHRTTKKCINMLINFFYIFPFSLTYNHHCQSKSYHHFFSL